MGRFPSGQRGQTVNLLQLASVVRIHLCPLYIGKDLFFYSEFRVPFSGKDSPFCFLYYDRGKCALQSVASRRLYQWNSAFLKKSFTGNFCGKWKLEKAAKTMILREELMKRRRELEDGLSVARVVLRNETKGRLEVMKRIDRLFSPGIPYKYEEALKLAGEYQRIFEEEAKSLQAKKYMELSLPIPCIRFILFMNSVTCGKWYRL